MIQLVAEIEHADSPDIFDYIVEAFEYMLIKIIKLTTCLYQ